MTFPLIGPEQDFALWSILIALAGFGFWCERYSWGRKYSGVMLLITAAIVLANLRIIPTSAPAYDASVSVWASADVPRRDGTGLAVSGYAMTDNAFRIVRLGVFLCAAAVATSCQLMQSAPNAATAIELDRAGYHVVGVDDMSFSSRGECLVLAVPRRSANNAPMEARRRRGPAGARSPGPEAA